MLFNRKISQSIFGPSSARLQRGFRFNILSQSICCVFFYKRLCAVKIVQLLNPSLRLRRSRNPSHEHLEMKREPTNRAHKPSEEVKTTKRSRNQSHKHLWAPSQVIHVTYLMLINNILSFDHCALNKSCLNRTKSRLEKKQMRNELAVNNQPTTVLRHQKPPSSTIFTSFVFDL